jgi:hypothetical protein
MAAELSPHPSPFRPHSYRVSGLFPLRLPDHRSEAFMQPVLGFRHQLTALAPRKLARAGLRGPKNRNFRIGAVHPVLFIGRSI